MGSLKFSFNDFIASIRKSFDPWEWRWLVYNLSQQYHPLMIGSVHLYLFVCISFVESSRAKLKSFLILRGCHKNCAKKFV